MNDLAVKAVTPESAKIIIITVSWFTLCGIIGGVLTRIIVLASRRHRLERLAAVVAAGMLGEWHAGKFINEEETADDAIAVAVEIMGKAYRQKI